MKLGAKREATPYTPMNRNTTDDRSAVGYTDMLNQINNENKAVELRINT